jgi:hypothetical protein
MGPKERQPGRARPAQGHALAEKEEDLLQLGDVVLGGVQDGEGVEGEVGQVIIVGRLAPGQDEVLVAGPHAGHQIPAAGVRLA